MTTPRHQRASEKLQAMKATRRYQTSQTRFGNGAGSVLTESIANAELDSKSAEIEKQDTAVEVSPEVQPDIDAPQSPVGRVHEGPMEESKSQPTKQSYVKDDTHEVVVNGEARIDSPKATRKSPDGDMTPKSKTMSRVEETKDTTPTRRFIIDDERRATSGIRSKAPVRNSPNGRVSTRRHKKSRKVRIKTRPSEDDASSADSQLESFLSEDKSEGGVASALDHIFDYFTDDLRSFDDSYSERTERTERTEELYPNAAQFEYTFFSSNSSKSKGGIFKEVEDLFIDRLSCGPAIPECQDLGTQTFSYDESTDYGRKDRRGKSKRQSARSRRSTRKPSKETDVRSVDLSSAILEDETESGTLNTTVDSKVDESQAASTYASTYYTEKEYGKAPSFDTNDGADWRNPCHFLTSLGDGQDRGGKMDMVRGLLHRSFVRAGRATMDMKSDASSLFPSLQEPGASVLGDGTATSFTDEFTNETGHPSEATKVQEIVADNKVDTTNASQSDVEEIHADNKVYTMSEVYAPAKSMKPSSSFDSFDSQNFQKEVPESGFQQALSKLREDAALASQTLQGFQNRLKAIDFASGGSISIPDKVKEVLSFSRNTDQVPPLTGEAAKSTPARRVCAFSCTEVSQVDSFVIKGERDTSVDVGPEIDDLVKESTSGTHEGENLESQQGTEEPFVVVKPLGKSDPETGSVETKDTSRGSTEDEAENDKPKDGVCLELADVNESIETIESQETIPWEQKEPMQPSPVQKSEVKSKKKGKLRRQLSKLVRSWSKKHSDKRSLSKAVAVAFDSQDKGVNSGALQGPSSLNMTTISLSEPALGPFDPSRSLKAKREEWKRTKLDEDEFDNIISTKARADDWAGFVEFDPCIAKDVAAKVSL